MSYVDHGFYDSLVSTFSDWGNDPVTEPGIKEECRSALEREARLLDQHRYDDWLALFAPECLYWVPASVAAGDPRREVAVCFDDRRRIEDRIYRLKTGYAWSQAPASRTVRFVSNVEVFETGNADVRMVRSNFLISEFRSGESRSLSGWCGHRLAKRTGSWMIEVKQVNLIDCDQNLRNPSIVF
jgi:benzoate/toluate 1,2-dioxygenase beta subunit